MNLLERLLKIWPQYRPHVEPKAESDTTQPKHEYKPANRKISQFMQVQVFNSKGEKIETRQI